ncbi:Uma2 family endonuclease [Streptosporangium becharense]|uniref:Uma2 family endonuclease n=1 Tax=Streptosporangium becharense TaxID=1816182 RepID=A0A7W9IE92_9ACTN|nr:Uma2 family endonuclease [Streptosporangium becharense]MBB2911997.1 Uma2 family endonuclease [Streptosporangium becharense]MBB5818544.1 Uma2 family endonuclease [Streptosporangium becharense]
MATTEPTTRRTVLQGEPPFTVDDLLRFPDDGNRYELFNGSLLVSPSPTPMHQFVSLRLVRILEDAAPAEFQPLQEVNLRVGRRDFFIPDLVVVPAAAVAETELMFRPEDVLLAVEIVSPTTEARDRHLKRAAYAAAGIPVYWRVELGEGPSIHVHELAGDEYKPAERHEAGETAALLAPFEVRFDPGALLLPRT